MSKTDDGAEPADVLVLCGASDQSGSAVTPPAPRDSRRVRSVNTNVRQSTERFTYADPVILFCECDPPGWFGAIAMSGYAFEAWTADGSAVLVATARTW